MTFVELYGVQLDQELGSADRTERFTTTRRKAAINDAQLEFVRLTDCFQARAQIDLVAGIAEYDLEALVSDESFFRFTDQQPYLQMTDANGNVTYIDGQSFPRVDIPLLDREQPGWRTGSSSIPCGWYLREDLGRTFFGVQPAPSFSSGSSGLVLIPYSAFPATMVADTDEPFQNATAGNPKATLRAYHKALVHYAAGQLELLRRDRAQSDKQIGHFNSFVRDYLARRQPTGGTHVSQAHDYFRAAQSGGVVNGWERDWRR